MAISIIRVGPDQVDEFVALVAQMNAPGRYDQDPVVERQLLLGTHPLCEGLGVRAFLARSGGSTVGRIAVTLPHGSDQAHVGFLQAPGSGPVARALFDAAITAAVRAGRRVALGPVDGSPWYRHWLTLTPPRSHASTEQTGAAGAGSDLSLPLGRRQPHLLQAADPAHHLDLWQAAGFTPWLRAPSLVLTPAASPPDSDSRPGLEAAPTAAGTIRDTAAAVHVVHPHRSTLDATLARVWPVLLEAHAGDSIPHTPSTAALAEHLVHQLGRLRPEHVWVATRTPTEPDATADAVAIALPVRPSSRGWLGRSRDPRPAVLAQFAVGGPPGASTQAVAQALLTVVVQEHASRGQLLICPPRLAARVQAVHRGQTLSLSDHLLLRRTLPAG